MKKYLKEKIADIADGKLTNDEIEELIAFFRHALTEEIDQDDELFFKNLAFEISGSVKELALLIINFRRDLKSKIDPDITELTTKYIPQAADQLENIIETTEMAANRIMDNLDIMQEHTEKMETVMASLKLGKIIVPGCEKDVVEAEIDDQTNKAIAPLIDYFNLNIQNYMTLVSDTFVQMSFQDLTGQRIKRIMALVQEMEAKLKKMVVSFGIKIVEREKHPDITVKELQTAVAEKESELAGPQKMGCGLDQAGIDDLLANI